MESVKEYVISWLDWGVDYVKDDPQDFFTKCWFKKLWLLIMIDEQA